MKRAQAKIDKIMSDAYCLAFQVVEKEVKAFMKADKRFVEFCNMVGWGPGFITEDGTVFDRVDQMPTKRSREIMEFANEFYDTYGAANERVKAD